MLDNYSLDPQFVDMTNKFWQQIKNWEFTHPEILNDEDEQTEME